MLFLALGCPAVLADLKICKIEFGNNIKMSNNGIKNKAGYLKIDPKKCKQIGFEYKNKRPDLKKPIFSCCRNPSLADSIPMYLD